MIFVFTVWKDTVTLIWLNLDHFQQEWKPGSLAKRAMISMCFGVRDKSSQDSQLPGIVFFHQNLGLLSLAFAPMFLGFVSEVELSICCLLVGCSSNLETVKIAFQSLKSIEFPSIWVKNVTCSWQFLHHFFWDMRESLGFREHPNWCEI